MLSHGREKTMKPLQNQSEIEFDIVIDNSVDVIGTVLFLVNLSLNNYAIILITLLCYVTLVF